MMKLDELIELYYAKFVGLPTGKPIVRQNQKNDAFEIVVLETLYGSEKNISINKMDHSDVVTLSQYIVAPPDEGIDIVIEHEDIDESYFDFIQVKNAELSQLDIQQAFSYMEKTVERYFKRPQDINENLRSVLAQTNLSSGDKANCRYIVVHRGVDNYFKGQKEGKEQVITGTELEIIRNCASLTIPRVPMESFGADSFNNFILYEESENEPAILLNLCGYDLAELAIKYTNTSLGRNILFGQNLRESLGKSKTYDGMAKTIREEPEKFWFYNNGITAIAENFDAKKKDDEAIDRIVLKEFSIINGAQTTSALGRFLKEARMNNNVSDIEQLKKVFVLARILKVTDSEFKSKIAIYNNTQNPITTRDMASNREEQLQLHRGLLNGISPNIYVEIRRGMKPPIDMRFYKHQITTNEELAQLAFAGYKRDPFTAKDKKNAIFDTDHKQTEYLLNEFYHQIFHYDGDASEGILFKKNKEEINELLFVHLLYKEGKKKLLKIYKERIGQARKEIEITDDSEVHQKLENRIVDYEKLKAICNICVFYCIAYYYSFKSEFPSYDNEKVFLYDKFYSDKEFQKMLVDEFIDMFLSGTIQIIKELTVNSPNLNTWVRDKKSTGLFTNRVDEKIQIEMLMEKKYQKFVECFKE